MMITTKQKIALLSAVLVVVICVGVVVMNTSISIIETEPATAKQVADSIYTEGVFIRDESLVTYDIDGVISYIDETGLKVSKGGKIANIYESEEDVKTVQELQRLTNEIKQLEKITVSGKNITSGLDTVEKQMKQSAIDLVKAVKDNDFSSCDKAKSQLLFYMNQRKLITGEETSYSDAISELKAQKAALEKESSSAVSSITSDIAGFFSPAHDGYEDVFNYSHAPNMTLDEYNKLSKNGPAEMPENVIGKMITKLNWYVVCPITAEEATRLSSQTNVEILLPYVSTQKLPVEVVSINQKDRNSDGVAVLQCKNLNGEFSALRQETVRIDVENYEGIRIPKSAVHTAEVDFVTENEYGAETVEKKNVKGVYIQYGTELRFKQIHIIYSGEDFVLCEEQSNFNSSKFFDGTTVEMFDRIVVKGTDLYDGKIVTNQ